MLRPNQFNVDEAWIAFKLNDAPICTERYGEFNCICLMDAASCFILGTALVAHAVEPSELEMRRLFKSAQAKGKKLPTSLYLPIGEPQTTLTAEAKRLGISVTTVRKGDLRAFTHEARQGFRDYLFNMGNEA